MINKEKRKPRRPHQFRFQLLHEWLVSTYPPCKAADIGGGKGLLAHLLNESGWQTTVIDPVEQLLPYKFRNAEKKRVKLTLDERSQIARISKPFNEEMAQDFDLLIGLHAHGSNLKIISAATKYNKNFVLLPCCVVDEPLVKKPGINWINSLEEYAKEKGFSVKRTILNFKGQNIVLYTDFPIAGDS